MCDYWASKDEDGRIGNINRLDSTATSEVNQSINQSINHHQPHSEQILLIFFSFSNIDILFRVNLVRLESRIIEYSFATVYVERRESKPCELAFAEPNSTYFGTQFRESGFLVAVIYCGGGYCRGNADKSRFRSV